MNRNHKIGIVTAVIAAIMIAIPVYLYWAYGTPESLYRRGLATAFWLSLENDTRDLIIEHGQTKTMPVELHYWKDLDTALYVELRSDDGSGMDKYPDGLSVSYDLDGSVISLSKGASMVLSKNEAARSSPPLVKQGSSDGQMVIREFGNLTVSASRDVPAGSYYFELSTGDTKINGGGGNSQLLTVIVVDDGGEPQAQKITLLPSWPAYHSISELVSASSDIVVGQVLGVKRSDANSMIPTTDFDFRVDRVVKGNLEPQETITIRQTGAQNSTVLMEILDDPLLKQGETLLGFTRYSAEHGVHVILGGPQGRFVVEDGVINSMDNIYPRDDWISVKVKDGNLDQFIKSILEEMDSP